MNVTTMLLKCLNKEQVEKVLIAQIKRTTGWDVTTVEFKDMVMTIFVRGVRQQEQLLVTNLSNGHVIYGRLGIHGLCPVDLTIIQNAVS